MIYLNNSFEIVEDNKAIFQIHIPRTKSSLPRFFINKNDKRLEDDKVINKIIAELSIQGIHLP